MGSSQSSSWHELAAVREDDIRVRLVLAAFIALAGALAQRGASWPLIWFAASAGTQLLTFLVARPVLRDRPTVVPRRHKLAILACVGLTASVFAAAGVLFWFLGGWGGRLFAMIIVAGGALSVAARAGASARLFWTGCAPLMAVLQALPLISFALAPEAERGVMGMTAFAATLFVLNLAAGGRQSIASAREIERALRAAREERQRAEAASAAKSEFLALMSHELRTPLNGVLGMAQAMAGEDLSPHQQERLVVLRRSAESLLLLVNDVLAVSKPDGAGVSAERVEPELSEAPLAAELWRAGERLRVLAAEDNPTNRLVLKTLLEQLGVAVHIVSDGHEVVDAWRSAPWDLVLMDIRMPGVDGVAATHAIRAEEAASGRPRTPIIAVTADATAPQAADYMSVGMDGLAPKPIQLPQLVAVINAALGVAPLEPARATARPAA